jgi:arabinogalactan oligomer / maltooligosaccharide transport system substrate-binding protein
MQTSFFRAVAMLAALAAPSSLPAGPVSITLWCEDGTAGIIGFARRTADELAAVRHGETVRVEAHDPLDLLREMAAASASGRAPELVWADWARAGDLADEGLILPADGLVDLRQFLPRAVESLRKGRRVWGVPVSTGGCLVLYTNAELVPVPPRTTDELLSQARRLAAAGKVGLAWNQTDPYWLVPWLHGFGGALATPGGSPTLSTPAMASALALIQEMARANTSAARRMDAYEAGRLFASGKAGMVVDGEWSLQDYRASLGTRLVSSALPRVSATGEQPRPFFSGTCLMIGALAEGDRLAAARAFIRYCAGFPRQVALAWAMPQMPALSAALKDPLLKGDPARAGMVEQMQSAVALPEEPGYRCIWMGVKIGMRKFLDGQATAREAAEGMQRVADDCMGTR